MVLELVPFGSTLHRPKVGGCSWNAGAPFEAMIPKLPHSCKGDLQGMRSERDDTKAFWRMISPVVHNLVDGK